MPPRSAEKRPAEGAPDPPPRRAKRRRWDAGDDPEAPPAPPPPPPPAPAIPAAAPLPSADALAKAKAVLKKQKEALAAKLASVAPKLEAADAAADAAANAADAAANAAEAAANAEAARKNPPPAPALTEAQTAALAKAREVAAAAKAKIAAAREKAGAGAGRAAAFPPPPPSKTAKVQPRALRLNANGDEIDEDGNVVKTEPRNETSTFKVNARSNKLDAFAAAERAALAEAANEDEAWADPRVGAGGRRREKRTGFRFVREGMYQEQAELTRLNAKFGETEARKMVKREASAARASARADKLEREADPSAIPLGARLGIDASPAAAFDATAAARRAAAAAAPETPDVEWWDRRVLAPGATYADLYAEGDAALAADVSARIAEDVITVYVEHPVPMEPPSEAPPPPPQPLKLTKQEQRKLRTQRRTAREQERQEMIRQGLIDPPKPKVKISNLMRVLTDEATADPTAVEREVRAQMEERQNAHDDRNEARKLTPAERKEKKMRKLLDDPAGTAAGETQVCVYRVESMANPKNKFRVDINAQENHLTGACLISDSFAVVVVEGGAKGVRRYEKLMLRRIDWNAPADDEDPEEEEDEDFSEDAGGGARRGRNACRCVWKGAVPAPAFRGKFRVETVRSEAAARKVLADVGLAHYFDAAAAAGAADPTEDRAT